MGNGLATYWMVSCPINSVKIFSSPSSSSDSESIPGVKPNVFIFRFFFLPKVGGSGLLWLESLWPDLL